MEYNLVLALNYLIASVWALSVAYSLIKLRNMETNTTTRAIWAAVIVLVPFVGAIAFLLVTGRQAT